MQTTKPWSVSATLRGFYDDNINTTHDNKVHAYGFEVSPSVSVGVIGEQTAASLGYTYSGKYYDHRPAGSSDRWDHTHTFDAGLSHSFSPRAEVRVQDSFVIGQEPDILRAGNTYSAFQRISGDNIRNYGTIVFNFEVTRLLGFEVGYGNAWYDYDHKGALISGAGLVVEPSRSGVLDRMEHAAHVDSRWHIRPQTTGVLGYKFGQTEYWGDEPIGGNVFIPSTVVRSDDRNNRSHYVYGGLDHNFTPQLSGSVRIGAQYIDFFNDPTFNSEWSPYTQGSLRYFYLVDSSVEVGVMHQRSAADLVGLSDASTGTFVHDQEATTAYGLLRHRILPRLYGSLMGTYQHSTYNEGQFNDQNDDFYLVGVNLEYRFNPHFSAHAGYNYDRLDSDISGRSFTRNRVYVGVTAAY